MTPEWASRSLRQMVIQQIEDASRNFGKVSVKTSEEHEQYILDEAQSRDHYLQMVGRLILHIKEVGGRQTPASSGSHQLTNSCYSGGGTPQMVTIGDQGIDMIQREMKSIPQHLMPHSVGNTTRSNQYLQHNLGPLEWATPSLRQMIIQQIEETLRKFGNILVKTSVEYEHDILENSQSRDHYLQMVARFILHIKEVRGNVGHQTFEHLNDHQSLNNPSVLCGPGASSLMGFGNPGAEMMHQQMTGMPQYKTVNCSNQFGPQNRKQPCG